ncbi:MAG: MBL fold metallo-hydrolase [Planctomycetota bacterium]|jgi:glyoxylase-like metal-dependent hydrolase (beta-lactamase superfamily II)
MTVEYRVISIGAMSRHRLWGEGGAVRTAHATTTLVADGDRLILVDPSLPATALAARFNERTGKTLDDVTDVFCTTLRPVHRRSIEALAHANWWTSDVEIEAYAQKLAAAQRAAESLESDTDEIDRELSVVRRFRPAPEKFSPQVSLYPLFGPSPGSCGLLLTTPVQTIVIAGDAAVTREHLQAGQVWEGCVAVDTAMDTLTDLVELADIVVCGHDNLIQLGRNWL